MLGRKTKFMVQAIKKLDSSLLDFPPVIEYLRQFEKCEIVNEDIKEDNGEVNISSESELIRIIYLKMSTGKWWSIYRYHSNGIKYEQIDAILFNELKENRYNKVIKFSGHVEDNAYSYITCSNFSFLNNEVIHSWKETRVVPVQDLYEIQYSKDMNLTELVLMADNKSQNIIKQENQQDIKALVLKLEK